ncbi:roundabout homolog 3 isoform X2 [Protopterus annectens]|uniref:roundabout homolog 3 isoform X2 n=1 Tax=Protopterus annectens TaxID=7888 RepID=UPI001CF98693|nr:roundabout homolog 3 isoform X2 [Protopterus annectens]
MLRYLLKTLLQMNLFADSIPGENTTSTELYFNLPSNFSSFNASFSDFDNLTSFNGSRPRLEDFPPRIVEHPSDLIVSKGEPATLNCKAEGRPNPIIEWYKDGERVETDKDDPRSHRMLLPTGSLFFLRIVHGRRSKPDEGMYVCVARNYLGEAVSRNASLEVAILRDDFRQTPSDTVVAAGEPAVMECIPPRGHPEPTISWKKDNIQISDKDERVTIRGGKLMISHTRKSDAGKYICIATNMVGERDSEAAELVVFERPSFVKRPVNQVVLEGDRVDFNCEVHGDPIPSIRWRKDEGELPPGRYEVTSGNTLSITRVSAEDEGMYTCISENTIGKVEASGSLSVHVGTFLPPRLVTRPRDQIVTRGRTVSFQCETKGNPPPAVFWQKEGSQKLLFPNQTPQPLGHFSVSLNGVLTISDVQPDDSGYYMCQAISVAGSILAKVLLEVEDVMSDRIPPIIRRGPVNQTLTINTTAQLQCHVMGNPVPTVQWLKDGQKVVDEDPRAALLANSTLQIANLQVTDSGLYSCVATSSSGETTQSGYLEIRESIIWTTAQPSDLSYLPGSPAKPLITDVTKNSVTLIWQQNTPNGGDTVSLYIIEAFSQSAGGTWQTVASNVKVEKHTVTGLNPNTVYLFLVRAMNSYGVSDPSPVSEPVRTQDVSPTGEGVNHIQVQKELGAVAVQLQNPVVLSSSSVQVSWTVDKQSQFVQGYRVMYRSRFTSWLVQDVKSPSECSFKLTELKKGTEYEIKIRPYFDEFQGIDSEVLSIRTPEEAPSAPPQAVSVLTYGLSNTTSVSISWEPPPADEQNGIIKEYRVWCLGNETRFHINRTVDGAMLSTVLRGLVAGVQYRIEVAAVTSAGIGVKSQPVTIRIEPSLDQNSVTVDGAQNVSLAEQITDVVKQPAFIAGIGGACWVILMCFTVWIYCRRKKRKELSHYTASFAYTPAVSFPQAEGSGLMNRRPGMLTTNMSNYPWLADSWPATNLMRNGKDMAVACCATNADSSDRYYNAAGISNYIAQTEKFGMTASDGAIYSTIDPSSDEMHTFNGSLSQNPTPYATTPVVPFGGQCQHVSDQESNMWSIQPGSAAVQYAQPDRSRTENVGKMGKQKSVGKAVKTPSLNWSEQLPPPPSASELGEYTEEEERQFGYETEDWCPPLPERPYLTEPGIQGEGPPPPPRGEASSPASSYGQQSTATLTPSPREDMCTSEDIPRLHQFEILQLPRRLPVGPVPLPRPPTPPLTQSNPDLNALEKNVQDHNFRVGHRRNLSQTAAMSAENVSASDTGNVRNVLRDGLHTPPGQKSRAKRKHKAAPYRKDLRQGDLPPPPDPPPVDTSCSSPLQNGRSLDCSLTSLDQEGSASSSMERREERGRGHRKTGGNQHRGEEDVIPYSRPNFLSRSQLSSNCSTAGSSSSRGSAGSGSRGHGSGRSRTTGDRTEDKR